MKLLKGALHRKSAAAFKGCFLAPDSEIRL